MVEHVVDFLVRMGNNIYYWLAAPPPIAFLIGFAVDRITGRRERYPSVSLPGKHLERYTDRKHAPLGWHRLMQFVMLPMWAVVEGLALYLAVIYQAEKWSLLVAASVFPISSLVLLIVAFVAFLRWNRVGVFCCAAYHFYGIVYGAVWFLYIYMTGIPSSRYWQDALLHLEWLLVTVVYYRKRDLLFTGTKAAAWNGSGIPAFGRDNPSAPGEK